MQGLLQRGGLTAFDKRKLVSLRTGCLPMGGLMLGVEALADLIDSETDLQRNDWAQMDGAPRGLQRVAGNRTCPSRTLIDFADELHRMWHRLGDPHKPSYMRCKLCSMMAV